MAVAVILGSMRTLPRRSRIGQFKAPFLASIAGAAVSAIACGGRTPTDTGDPAGSELTSSGAGGASTGAGPDGTSGQGASAGQYGVAGHGSCSLVGTFCNPPGSPYDSQCPPDMPVAGTACYGTDQDCRYPGCEGPESSTATCVGGQWLVHYSSGPACNPPAVIPLCPNRPIPVGVSCAYEGQECSKLGDCSIGEQQQEDYRCLDGIWTRSSVPCPGPGWFDAGNVSINDAGSAPDAGL